MEKRLLLFASCLLLTSCSSAPLSSTSWLASAAIAAVVSAIVSGLIAILIKDKEYKNDYYKKVIEKRLKAIETVEETIGFLAPRSYNLITGELYHSFFTKPDEIFVEFNKSITKSSQSIIWLSNETSIAVDEFCKTVTPVFVQCYQQNPINSAKIAQGYFEVIDKLLKAVHKSIRKDMIDLYNINNFLRAKSRIK